MSRVQERVIAASASATIVPEASFLHAISLMMLNALTTDLYAGLWSSIQDEKEI